MHHQDTNARFVSPSALLRLKPCRNQPHTPLPVPERRSQPFVGDVSRLHPVKALRLLNPTNKASNRTFDLISSHDQNSQSRLCLSRPLARWKHQGLQARPTGDVGVEVQTTCPARHGNVLLFINLNRGALGAYQRGWLQGMTRRTNVH